MYSLIMGCPGCLMVSANTIYSNHNIQCSFLTSGHLLQVLSSSLCLSLSLYPYFLSIFDREIISALYKWDLKVLRLVSNVSSQCENFWAVVVGLVKSANHPKYCCDHEDKAVFFMVDSTVLVYSEALIPPCIGCWWVVESTPTSDWPVEFIDHRDESGHWALCHRKNLWSHYRANR